MALLLPSLKRATYACLLLTFASGPAVGGAAPPFVPGTADPRPGPPLRHSHVIVWCDQPDDHRNYPEADVIVQDLDITDEIDLPKWQALGRQWHAQGKLFFAELRPATPLGRTFEALMDDPGLRAAGCVDIAGQVISPAWQAGRTYQGHPIQFFCSNNPRYRSFLRHLIFLYHEAGADGLFVDDAGGTPGSYSQGGCFCLHCLARFREYLLTRYTQAEWRALRLGEFDTFDYRALVRQRAPDRASLLAARQRGELPLQSEFAEFLRQSDAALFHSLHATMDKLSGRHVPLAWDNYNFSPARTPYYPTIDVFAPEIAFGSFVPGGRGDNTRFAPATVLLNRLSDALGKWYSPIPAPPTWAAAKARQLTGMLRLWIAATYANGGIPRYPRKGWCGMGADGTVDWYHPPKAEFAPLYDFVRSHRRLFDDYEAVAQVGLVFAEKPGDVIGDAPIKALTEQLVNLNVPFGIAFAGGPVLSRRLDTATSHRFEMFLVPASTRLDPDQQQIVDTWRQRNAALLVGPDADIAALLAGRVAPLVALESAHDLRLFPRRHARDRSSPVLCHIVNWNYDPATNRAEPQRNIALRLRTALAPGARVTQLVLHAPGRTTQTLEFARQGDTLRVTVPEIALWGVLEIRVD